MTLFAILWAASLPALGIPSEPSQFTALAEAPHVAPSQPEFPIPLQGLGRGSIQALEHTIDWERWQHMAAVTVVAPQPLADGDRPMPSPLADTLVPANCPVAQAPTATEADPPGATPEPSTYVIRVKGVAIGQVASAAAANQVAEDLRLAMPTLAQHPQHLFPTLREETGVGKIMDTTIFTLPPEAIGDEDSMALTTAQWVNNLRLGLGADPLHPGQVQRVAYGLEATATRFQGTASWYGPYFHGRKTATGEIFDQEALTAAHKTLPFNTYLEVRNLLNGKTVVVRINDRGPYVGDRSLDLSYAAARCLGSTQVGVIPYEATLLTPDAPHTWEEAALPL